MLTDNFLYINCCQEMFSDGKFFSSPLLLNTTLNVGQILIKNSDQFVQQNFISPFNTLQITSILFLIQYIGYSWKGSQL